MDQVFLVNGRSIARFVEAASRAASSSDVLEVGPGLGSITLPLSSVASRLVAVEVDRRLGAFLGALASACGPGNVLVVSGDGVSVLASARAPVLVSNTPYSISSRIISVAARNNSVETAILGLQLDVARRVLARPGSSDYGRLTLLVRRYFKARLVSVIPRSHYYPMPRVDGSVLELTRLREWREGDELFEALTACLFSQRNKLASKILLECSERVAGKRVSLDVGSKRVRDLSLDDVERVMAELAKA
jgi:16S rRNA (adenine1518-N6/adenine1519-N6)-dimethyltransferase